MRRPARCEVLGLASAHHPGGVGSGTNSVSYPWTGAVHCHHTGQTARGCLLNQPASALSRAFCGLRDGHSPLTKDEVDMG